MAEKRSLAGLYIQNPYNYIHTLWQASLAGIREYF